MSSAAFIVNLRSRKARRNPTLIADLAEIFGHRGPFFQTKTLEELQSAVRQIQTEAPRQLFLFGGDGTLHETLARLENVWGEEPWPAIVLLRGGTMNTVATALGLPKDPKKHLRAVLAKLDEALEISSTLLRPLKVNDRLGFIFSVGGFERFIRIYLRVNHPTPLRGARLLLQTAFSILLKTSMSQKLFAPFPIRFRTDHSGPVNDVVSNLAAASIRDIGFHFKPFRQVEPEQGRFSVLVFRQVHRRFILHLPKFYSGQAISDPAILQTSAQKLRIELQCPSPAMMDGDLLPEQSTFEIQSGPPLMFVGS